MFLHLKCLSQPRFHFTISFLSSHRLMFCISNTDLSFLGHILGIAKESKKQGYPTDPTRSACPTNYVSSIPWAKPRKSQEIKEKSYPTKPMPHTRSAYPTNFVSQVPWTNPKNSQGVLSISINSENLTCSKRVLQHTNILRPSFSNTNYQPNTPRPNLWVPEGTRKTDSWAQKSTL